MKNKNDSLSIYIELSEKYSSILCRIMGLKSKEAIKNKVDNFEVLAQEALGKYSKMDDSSINKYYITQINEMRTNLNGFL